MESEVDQNLPGGADKNHEKHHNNRSSNQNSKREFKNVKGNLFLSAP
jgi:hypothetical protein